MGHMLLIINFWFSRCLRLHKDKALYLLGSVVFCWLWKMRFLIGKWKRIILMRYLNAPEDL